MIITRNFTLEELYHSDTALRLSIDNKPPGFAIYNLTLLAHNVLQPIRTHFKKPVIVTSGYRSPLLEMALYKTLVDRLQKEGGDKAVNEWLQKKSHPRGEAADFEIMGIDNLTAFNWVKDNLEFDQLFLENHNPQDPASGWVHVSFRPGNRNEAGVIQQ